jgi:hypothetical protein
METAIRFDILPYIFIFHGLRDLISQHHKRCCIGQLART